MSTSAPDFQLKFVTGNDDPNNNFQGVGFELAPSGNDYSLEMHNYYTNQQSASVISSDDFEELKRGLLIQRTSDRLALLTLSNEEARVKTQFLSGD